MTEMKGDSTGAIVVIVLIVIVIVAVFLLYGNIFNGANGPIIYSNDGISIEQKFVFDRAPYEGQKTTIEFAVKNNGKGEVEKVKLSLEPPTGFKSHLLTRCDDIFKNSFIGNPSWCEIGEGKFNYEFNLEEGDAEFSMITLEAISGITQVIPVSVRYSISYPYKGEREFHMPIVLTRDDLPKGQTYFISDSTYGPIQVDVVPPASREVPSGGTAVYAIAGTQIKFDFSVSNVGTSQYGAIDPVIMSRDDLKLSLKSFKPVFCDKMDEASDGTLKLKDIYASEEKSGFVTRLTVPFQVKCVLEAVGKEGEVVDGSVKFDFNYNYRISVVDNFNIIPRGVPKVLPEEPEKNNQEAGGEFIPIPCAPNDPRCQIPN